MTYLSHVVERIFHPYGSEKKTELKEAQWSPLSDSERKDSLKINIEFVKFQDFICQEARN